MDSIIYRGEEPEKLKELYLQGKISVSSQEKLHEISDELTELNKQYNDSDRELGMQEAMLNRLEGSVSYAISQIEERYGTYEEFECDDPDGYVKNNTVITRELEDGIETVKIDFPSLICVVKNFDNLTRPTINGFKKAQNLEIENLSMENVGLTPEDVGIKGSPTFVSKAFRPLKNREACVFVENSDELLAKIKEFGGIV